LKMLTLFCVFLALIFTCEKLVGLISRNFPNQCKASFRVHSTFLAILTAQIENIFPHALSGDFFHAWNIKLSTKT
jgi:hypothetical protein